MSRLSKFNTPILAAPDRCADDRKPSGRPRSWLNLIAVLAAFSSLPLAQAVAPTLPVRFENLAGQSGQWTVGVITDTDQIGSVRVERSVYADGQRLRAEPVAVRPETDGTLGRAESRVRVPLTFSGMGELRQRRAFAQKIVVQGQYHAQPSGPGLQVQRWFYFRVRDGDISPVSAEEYAAITDPAEAATDGGGGRSLAHRGGALKAAVPLPETRGSPDQPITPQEAGRAAAPQRKADFSERHER